MASGICIVSREDKEKDGGILVTVRVQVASEQHTLNFWVSSGPVSPHNDFLLPFLIFPAMRLGLPITLPDVSPILLLQLRKIQETINTWWPKLFTPISINAEPRKVTGGKRGKKTGLFYSCGVDSQYTLYKHMEEIDSLIFIQGLDTATISLSDPNQSRLDRAYSLIKKSADKFPKPLIDVRTDVRSFTDKYSDFGLHYHGSALCGIAHLLAPQFGEFYIASSNSDVNPVPWGSHPLLEPLWSTEELGIRQDGTEALRIDKVAEIAKHQDALDHLYVCDKAKLSDSSYNCCECVFCLRTMILLYALKVLDRTPTFNKDLDFKKFARMPLLEEGMQRIVATSLSRITDPVAKSAVEDAVRGRYYTWYWRLGRKLKQTIFK